MINKLSFVKQKTLKKLYATLIIITLALNTNAQTITVKQDGTGDYTTIQQAINASSDGDVVLVWPGTYYENVDMNYKNITLTSLIHTTGDSTYKYTTIINGNKTGSCISVFGQNNTQTVVVIKGFTLTNGSGKEFQEKDYGGGICLVYAYGDIRHCIINNNDVDDGSGGGVSVHYYSDAVISNCHISNNRVTKCGGGIFCSKYSTLHLSKNNISYNHANNCAGGIDISLDSKIYFDSIGLCNIYCNFSSHGCDIRKVDLYQTFSMDIIVDTFTVLKPDSYFISSIDFEGFQLNDYTFSALNSVITPYNGDIYVNPVIGNNANTGTTPGDPLQSVAMAYSKIAVDSLKRNTIFLSDGIYSDSANNEKFPLNIRPFINIVGETMENTIFDGMNKTRFLQGNNEVSNYAFSKMHFIRGQQVDYEHISIGFIYANLYNQLENITIDSIIFDGGICESGEGALFIKGNDNINIKNSVFRNVKGERALNLSYYNSTWEDTLRIENCIFENNKPNPNNPMDSTSGGACRISSDRRVILVSNCLFNNNDYDAFDCINSQVWMNNCTFVNNSFELEILTIYIGGTKCYMYNCVLYNNYLKSATVFHKMICF